MPRLTFRKVSSGNGVKTAILNAKQVAKAIGRSLGCVTQWFGYALAVQAKQGQNQNQDQIILNGDHSDNRKLLNSLYEFIDIFVLCPACQNPETTMDVKDKNLFLHCHSCGNTSQVVSNKAAYVLKMADWIIQHIASENKQQPSTATTQVKGRIDAIDEFQKNVGGTDDGSQGVYINIEELTALQKSLEPQAETAPAETVSAEEIDKFFDEITKMCATDCSDIEIYKKFAPFAEKAQMNSSSKLKMIFEALFGGQPQKLLEIIEKRRSLLIRFTMEESSQRDMLSFMSQYICRTHPELMTSAPIIWYKLFDNEIIEEAAIQNWRQKPSSRFEKDKQKAQDLRNAILKDFFTWLAEAQFEQSESSDEEVVPEAKEEDDDLDIDNI
ncbi:Domain found in IF2B/IF5 family protein [Tritrichomonas foetus]|uniref:Domain found in IF2B/IF5 family protein n=1 Tax=Tritrichomonas foetus TaxID=1144522 RepID=A0A1J4KFH4_9EUKA|nr:Domain found in IF2B/IF5 family protein [Tritrichomonas foetus]|eukprot:OHT09778.1 Domain found in IF2B/IF5 family protein [Tritrichomonas foetus]